MQRKFSVARSLGPSLVRGDTVYYLGAIALLVLILLPLQPTFPALGLDEAWKQALNFAVDRRLRFGVDVVFTFGPYAFVYTQLYDPELFSATLLSNALIAAFILIAVHVLDLNAIQPRRLRTGVLLAFAIIAAYSPQDWMIVLPLMLFCMLLQPRSNFALYRVGWLAGVVTLALISLIKGGFLVASVASLFMLPIAGVRASRWLTSWAGYVLAVLLLWLMAGQNIGDLPVFLSYYLAVITGYSVAMAVSNKVSALIEAMYLVAAIWVVWRASTTRALNRSGLAECVTILLTLFFGFKAGLIRSDPQHIIMAASVLCLATCITMLRVAERVRAMEASLIAIAVASAAAVLLLGLIILSLRADAHGFISDAPTDRQSIITEISAGLRRLGLSLVHGPPNLSRRIRNGFLLLTSGTDRFDRQRELAFEDMRKAYPLEHAGGSVDIYTIRQDILLANGLDWNPRPVFQSFQAYTPALQALNAAHLEGLNSPQQIYFRPETIDGRLPALDDGSSWPVIRSRYEIVGIVGDYAHLLRREHPVAVSMESLAPFKIKFDEDLTLTDLKSSVYAQLDIHMTLAGRLLSLFYKPPALYVHVVTEPASGERHAEEREFRSIPGEAASGFLLSPLVISTSDFIAWMQDSKGTAVQRMSIRANWLARHAYSTPISVRLWHFSSVPVSPKLSPELK